MKRNLDTPILKLDGAEYADKPTLKLICFTAIAEPLPGDEKLTPVDKLKLYALAQKLHAGGVVDLSAEEIAQLKDRIGRGYSALVVGRAFELLEQDMPVATQAEFDAAVDRRDMPSGASHAPRDDAAPNNA